MYIGTYTAVTKTLDPNLNAVYFLDWKYRSTASNIQPTSLHTYLCFIMQFLLSPLGVQEVKT